MGESIGSPPDNNMSAVTFEKQQSAVISCSASGHNEIIAAPSQGYIAIDHIDFIPTTAVSVYLENGTTALTGVYPLDAKQAYTIENTTQNQDGIFTMSPETAFQINLDATAEINGYVRYRIIGK